MSKFIIACPVCHRYAEADTGFFARKHIRCSCGNTIHVKTDRMASKVCPSCRNAVVYDQADGLKAKCPVCHAALASAADEASLVRFRCNVCGCQLQADRTARSLTCPMCDSVADVPLENKKAEIRAEGTPSVISYEGDNRIFIWRHPMTDFVTGSQLIVRESQEAVFFRNGEALDSFGPGRHTLETGVLPMMEKLTALPVQGQPFHAEVYFINLATHMGIKWGTASKVGLFDPATGMHVELGASGSFNRRVIDPRRLLIRVVGATDSLTREQLFGTGGTGYFRSIIMTQVKTQLAKVIKANNFGVLELDARLDELSAAMRNAINPILAEYGMEMPEFFVGNIVLPEEDPNFRRMRQQHAERYLLVREEEIRQAEAEAAYERKAVEAQTAARMKVIEAQGDADVTRIRAQADAEAYRMQAEAEALEMQMKGYTYQQETSRQVALEAMRGTGSTPIVGGVTGGIPATGGVAGLAGEMMQLGIGLSTVGSVIGMTKDALQPVVQQAGGIAGWNCTCGRTGIMSNFCPNCGNRKAAPEGGWNCTCGQRGVISNFCPNCGNRKPAPAATWNCSCGQQGIMSPFCPGCGQRKPEPAATRDCACGQKGIASAFCPACGQKKEG